MKTKKTMKDEFSIIEIFVVVIAVVFYVTSLVKGKELFNWKLASFALALYLLKILYVLRKYKKL